MCRRKKAMQKRLQKAGVIKISAKSWNKFFVLNRVLLRVYSYPSSLKVQEGRTHKIRLMWWKAWSGNTQNHTSHTKKVNES